jgi:hypothetical protein
MGYLGVVWLGCAVGIVGVVSVVTSCVPPVGVRIGFILSVSFCSACFIVGGVFIFTLLFLAWQSIYQYPQACSL